MVDTTHNSKPQLHYWNIRGLNSYITLAFAASGKDYDLIEYNEDNEDQWYDILKPSLKMTLPNLPLLIDGDLLISEHDAIFRHVLRKYKPELLGNSIDEQAEIDQFISFWVKHNFKIRDYSYFFSKDHTQNDRVKFLEQFIEVFTKLDSRLKNYTFTMGENLSGADLYLFETFWMMKVIDPNVENLYPNINKVSSNVSELGWFKNYRDSDKWRNQLNWHEAFINNI